MRTFIPETLIDEIAGGKGRIKVLLGEYAGQFGKRIEAAGFMKSEILLDSGRTVFLINSEFISLADLEAARARQAKQLGIR